MEMVFTVIPPLRGEPRDSAPLPLAGGETSPLFEFFVSGEAQKIFIRVIALFRDNEPLGGEAPTFQIRAGIGGVITSVGPDSGEVSIPRGDGTRAGRAECQREPNDIFLITISDVVENSGPWMLRIRNNDPEPLRFLGFSSDRERDTLQPWMRLGDPKPSFISSHFEFFGEYTLSQEVRNWGTKPLIFRDELGPIGGRDSDFILRKLPGTVEPHHVDVITVEATQADTRSETTHQFSCNDTIEAHAKLSLEISPPTPVTPPPPPPEFFCRRGCGCDTFVGASTALVCERPS